MKTIRCLVLFPAVFVIVAMHVSCNSVGIAKEPQKPNEEPQQNSITHIVSQTIFTTTGGSFTVDLDPDTQCAKEVRSDRGKLYKISISDLLKVEFIEVPGSLCTNFVVDKPGNTYCYCSGGWCYCY